MQEININEEFLDDEVVGSVDLFIDDFIKMLETQKKELGVDAISLYVDEDGGVAMDLFDSTKLNIGEA